MWCRQARGQDHIHDGVMGVSALERDLFSNLCNLVSMPDLRSSAMFITLLRTMTELFEYSAWRKLT